jgi:hypothetical protein
MFAAVHLLRVALRTVFVDVRTTRLCAATTAARPAPRAVETNAVRLEVLSAVETNAVRREVLSAAATSAARREVLSAAATSAVRPERHVLTIRPAARPRSMFAEELAARLSMCVAEIRAAA